jgi:hypothetical protein
MTNKPCPICGRPVLCLGLTTCDACASHGNTVRQHCVETTRTREPRICRICLREFVPRTGPQKRCDDCCKDGRGGCRYENGKRVSKQKHWGEA